MRFNINTRLFFGFASAIFMVIMVGVISYLTFRKQTHEAAWVKHSYRVLTSTTDLQKLLADMETGRRGFRSTNQSKFLEPYYSGLTRLEPTLLNLRLLLADNAAQTERLNNAEQSIRELLEYWKNLGVDASLYSRERIAEISALEKAKMDEIRSKVGIMISVENGILSEREEANARAIKIATLELIFGILLILLIVGVLIYFIIKEFIQRRKAETELLNSNEELTEVNQASAEKNWLLAGLAEVNNILQGENTTQHVCESVVQKIVDYLGVSAGAIYLPNEAKNQLELRGAIALPHSAKKNYQYNEGYVGRAAIQQTPLILNDIPAHFMTIEGGTVQTEPVAAAYLPLVLNHELKAIIELLHLQPFGNRHLALLQLVSNNIAVALDSVQSRENIIKLLEKVQQQKEELENQQEELTQTNEELSVQTETLLASEEELRVREEELRQINAELEEKNNAVESAREALVLKAEELERNSKFKSEFLANMSHELRTPLNSVLILARLLSDNKENTLTARQVEHARIIHKSGSDLLHLINDILDLSKIEAGKVELVNEKVPIEELVYDVQLLFNVIAGDKGVHFTIHKEEGLPESIYTDKQKVEQVLTNLLSNAVKFTANEGGIEMTIRNAMREDKPMLAISIADNGIGIAPGKQQLIFEAFQQADGSTSRKYGGTGLGLSITRELTRLLGGTVALESEVGVGSTFTILLPLESELNAGKDRDAETLATATNYAPQSIIEDDRNRIEAGNKVMLIVEDDLVFATLVRDRAREKGYKAVVAIRGDEGLDYAIKYKPTAIILDLKLPVVDGSQLLKVLKQNPALKHIPVHIVSAADEHLADSAGALAFLKKPAQVSEIDTAFSVIGDYLQSAVKRILLFAESNADDDALTLFFNERLGEIKCDHATSVEECRKNISAENYDCLIADIGNSIQTGLLHLRLLRPLLLEKNVPLIIYLDGDISAADEMELKKVSEVVVRKSPSYNRLLDELDLFLYKVKESKLSSQVQTAEPIVINRDLKSRKVLLVDDDMRNIFAISAVLEMEEMNIITAADGREALEALKENKNIDIVLMDIMMPEMDGYEAIHNIRSEMMLSSLPIIALTAKAMNGDREKCIQAGASDYITKPVDTQKLVSLMRVWLS